MPEHEATLRRWLTDHRGILIRISRAYAADSADEEDLFQEILLALRALRTMTPVDRAVLLLALEGASQQEIADVCGISASQ